MRKIGGVVMSEVQADDQAEGRDVVIHEEIVVRLSREAREILGYVMNAPTEDEVEDDEDLGDYSRRDG